MTATTLFELLIYACFGIIIFSALIYVILDIIKGMGNIFGKGSLSIVGAFIIFIIVLAFIYVGTEYKPFPSFFHDVLHWHKFSDGTCIICGVLQ